MMKLLKIIWIIDVLNISFMINGIDIAHYLDVTIPINTGAWFFIFFILS